jgi:hypothetical protein
MEEAPENGKESSNSVRANEMNEYHNSRVTKVIENFPIAELEGSKHYTSADHRTLSRP